MSDGHLQGKNSINRLGDYFADWLIKFEEILSLAKKNKCEAILDGGDLFEGKNPSYSVIDAMADLVEQYKIPVYSLLGNHCMDSGHIENSKDTGLYHLQKRSGYFKYMPHIKCEQKYEIRPIEYKFGIEFELKDNGLGFSDTKRWKIAIIHALVTPKKFFENASYVTPEQISTNGDLILCGHYHHPFKKIVNGTEFLNIGCVGRLNINEANIEPSVLILDTDKRDYEIIQLKSAKKSTEIFDLSKYEELKKQEQSIDEFINTINSSEWVTLDVLGQIEKFAKENKFEKQVVDYILRKVKK